MSPGRAMTFLGDPVRFRSFTCTRGHGRPEWVTRRIASCSSQLSPSGRPSVRSTSSTSAGMPGRPCRRRPSSASAVAAARSGYAAPRDRAQLRDGPGRAERRCHRACGWGGPRNATGFNVCRTEVERGVHSGWHGPRWRPRGTVTSTSSRAIPSNCHNAAADMWEATAPVPAVRTAARTLCSHDGATAAWRTTRALIGVRTPLLTRVRRRWRLTPRASSWACVRRPSVVRARSAMAASRLRTMPRQPRGDR